MGQIGGLLLFFGIGGAVLSMFNVVFSVLAWVPGAFGEVGQYVFFAIIAVIGLVLLVADRSNG